MEQLSFPWITPASFSYYSPEESITFSFTSVLVLITTYTYLPLFIIIAKPVLKEANTLFVDRMLHRIASNKFASSDYFRVCNSVLNKVSFLSLLYSLSLRCIYLVIFRQFCLSILSKFSHVSSLPDFSLRIESLLNHTPITQSMISAIISKTWRMVSLQ